MIWTLVLNAMARERERGQPRACVPLGAMFLVLQLRSVGMLILRLMPYVHGNNHCQLFNQTVPGQASPDTVYK